MRDRLNLRQTVKPSPRVEAQRASERPATAVTRIFEPDRLDLDDLVDAIRLLLEPGHPPSDLEPDSTESQLLSCARRGTHVVEATGNH